MIERLKMNSNLYTKKLIVEAIKYWTKKLLRLNESRFFMPNNAGICLFCGKWQDANGHEITISDELNKDILEDMRHMEATNYASIPEVIMLDDWEINTVEDIATSYMLVSKDDAFIYYKGFDGSKYNLNLMKPHSSKELNGMAASAVSTEKDYAQAFYLLAASLSFRDCLEEVLDEEDLPQYGGPMLCNICDACGLLSLDALKNLNRFMVEKKCAGFFCNARRGTSNTLLDSRLLKHGFIDFSPEDYEKPNYMSNEEFLNDLRPRIFLRKAWVDKHPNKLKWMQSFYLKI